MVASLGRTGVRSGANGRGWCHEIFVVHLWRKHQAGCLADLRKEPHHRASINVSRWCRLCGECSVVKLGRRVLEDAFNKPLEGQRRVTVLVMKM